MKRLLIVIAAFLLLASPFQAYASLAFVTGAHGKGLQGAATPSLNFTGVDLIVVGQVSYSGNVTTSISDSLGNTYTALTQQALGNSTIERTQLFYKQNPTVSSTMTFTPGNVNADVYVEGFSGSASSPFDVQNGFLNTVGGTSVNPGSITPSGAGYLVTALGGMYSGTNGALPVNGDGNYTTTDSSTMVGSVSFGGAFSYFIQGSAVATNPTFSWTGTANDETAVIASFKPAATANKPPKLAINAATFINAVVKIN
jgi:hypothetical protein